MYRLNFVIINYPVRREREREREKKRRKKYSLYIFCFKVREGGREGGRDTESLEAVINRFKHDPPAVVTHVLPSLSSFKTTFTATFYIRRVEG